MYPVRLVSLALLVAAMPCQVHTHGDAVGPLGPDSAMVWTRASAMADVSVLYGLLSDLSDAIETTPVRVVAADDFNFHGAVTGLMADGVYYYRTRIADPNNALNFELGPIGRFRTPPDPEQQRVVRIAFSGDVDVTGNTLCDDILRANAELFVSLGDMPYADGSATEAQFWQKHKDARSDPVIQGFLRNVALAPIWDDHEIIDDWDSRVLAQAVTAGTAAWRKYMPVRQQRDIYRSLRWGRDLELFLLDCRSYRGNNDAPDVATKTMLGSVQLNWLLTSLRDSTATFKVVCSSVPLRHGTSGLGQTGNDLWDGFQRERDAILQYVLTNRIRGVVWMCADQHWAAAHEHPEGIREYVVGPLSKDTRATPTRPDNELRWIEQIKSWGLIAVTPGTPDPVLQVQIYGPSGVLYRDYVEARAPASYVVETGNPSVGFVLQGHHRYESAGVRVDLPERPPSNFVVDFVPSATERWRPAPLTFGVGSNERVWIAGRGQEVPTSVHQLLYADTFEGVFGTAAYQVVDETVFEGPSAWFNSGGQLFQASNIGNFPFDPTVPLKPGTLARFGDTQWTDYTVHVRARSRDDDNFGVYVRCSDQNNFYRLVFNRQFGFARLEKCVAGVHSILVEDRTFRYEPLVWYDLGLVVVGNSLQAYVDGELLLQATDSALTAGNGALYTWSNHVTAFDDLWVRRGNAMTGAVQALLRDGFNDAQWTGWTVVDQGDQEGPSDWAQSAGLLRQRSNIFGGDTGAGALAKPGTLAITGEPTWADYHFAASFRNTDDDAVGIVFRFVDPANHYRFSWDHERGYRRLAKVVNGTWSVLHEDAVVFRKALWHRVAAEVSGDRLRVFVDGALWCNVVDASLAQGKVGLYCWQSAGVEFDDVLVRPPYLDVASLAGRTQVGRVELVGRAPQGVGGAYVMAMAMSRDVGIPLAILNPSDTRYIPLDLDPIFVATLNPFPGLNGFRGLVPPDGAIQASVDLPNSSALRGRRVYIGGFVFSLTQFRVEDVLPSVEITFP